MANKIECSCGGSCAEFGPGRLRGVFSTLGGFAAAPYREEHRTQNPEAKWYRVPELEPALRLSYEGAPKIFDCIRARPQRATAGGTNRVLRVQVGCVDPDINVADHHAGTLDRKREDIRTWHKFVDRLARATPAARRRAKITKGETIEDIRPARSCIGTAQHGCGRPAGVLVKGGIGSGRVARIRNYTRIPLLRPIPRIRSLQRRGNKAVIAEQGGIGLERKT